MEPRDCAPPGAGEDAAVQVEPLPLVAARFSPQGKRGGVARRRGCDGGSRLRGFSTLRSATPFGSTGRCRTLHPAWHCVRITRGHRWPAVARARHKTSNHRQRQHVCGVYAYLVLFSSSNFCLKLRPNDFPTKFLALNPKP
jgi:hypothetical protein